MELRFGWITLCTLIMMSGGPAGISPVKSAAIRMTATDPKYAFYLGMEITNRVYNSSLRNPASAYYKTMYEEVSGALGIIYNCSSCGTSTSYRGVAEMTFRNGSVIANSTIVFQTSFINAVLVKSLFKYEMTPDNVINGLKINPAFTEEVVTPIPAVLPTSGPSTTTPLTRTSTKLTTTTKPAATTSTTKHPNTTTTSTSAPTSRSSTTSPFNRTSKHPVGLNTTTTTKPFSNTTTTKPFSNTNTTRPFSNTTTTKPFSNTTTTKPFSNTTTRPFSNTTTTRPFSNTTTTKPFSNTNTTKPFSSTTTTKPFSNTNTTKPFSNTTTSHPSGFHNISSAPNTSTTKTVRTEAIRLPTTNPPVSGGGVNYYNRVPGWAIALLVLACIILLLLIILLIITLIRWCCEDKPVDEALPEEHQEHQHTPYERTTFKEPLSTPSYSPQTPQKSPILPPYEDPAKPKPNRTGMYVVNPER